MIRLEYQILAAVGLDLALGDPLWLPHPVRGLGKLAERLENLTRRAFAPEGGRSARKERFAGFVSALATCATAGVCAWLAIRLAGLLHPFAADVVGILIVYAAIAARDLADHSMAVYCALSSGDITQARLKVGRIVGRDTERLDEAGVARATVESVAESSVDGVAAPLFYAIIAGPVGAIVYRAINTLDSMFGHKSERYINFGWASARVDDLANYIPARLAAPLMCAAAALVGGRPGRAFATLVRDGQKHESPNSGLPEAAMAGALGVQLGGLSYYGGEPLEKPAIGDPLAPMSASHIRRANALMFATCGLFLAIGLVARGLFVRAWEVWRATA